MKALRWLWLASFIVLSLLVVSCGGKKEDPKSPSKLGGMDDSLALLPGGAIMVGTVDARALFGSQTFGAQLAQLVEKYVPIGQEAGFSVSRDVDRVTFGVYSYQGADIAAVVVGKFDEAKIKQVAAAHTPVKGGAVLVVAPYAGRDLYTVSNVGFTLLGPTRAIVGTEAGLRRVLERIKDNRVNRDITPWMIQTVETSGAAAAVAVDLVSQPGAAEFLRQIPFAFAQNVRAVRGVGTFKEPGMQIAGSVTYPDAQAAQSASEGLKKTAPLVNVASGALGLKLDNLTFTPEKADVQVSVGVDDRSLRQMLVTLPNFLPAPPK